MLEELLVTVRDNPKVDPVLGIWGWEIPVYLFLGGLTAGIMVLCALVVLLRREGQAPFAARRYLLWAPLVLSVGMGALFLDLEHKLYVYRFYTTFQPSSPMSWGSWFLVLVYPASVLLVLATLRAGYPRLAAHALRYPGVAPVLDWCERHRRPLAGWNLLLGVLLGIYTGVLLSAFSARPFWNSGLLGPLFLVSGLSTAAALAVLAARDPGERHLFTRADAGILAVELTLVLLLVVDLATGPGPQLAAAGLILGGPYTLLFWGLFVGLGLLLPLLLELAELRGVRTWVLLAPLLVLGGGYLLRQATVELGQVSTWQEYARQHDPALLARLRSVMGESADVGEVR
jgi:formate-dependent nitrite reductase membrane component NrfD